MCSRIGRQLTRRRLCLDREECTAYFYRQERAWRRRGKKIKTHQIVEK